MAASDAVSEKSFDQLLRNASILDQFRLRYPIGRQAGSPGVNSDPGRFRNEEFFQRMYGDCRTGEVNRHLVAITWLPKSWGKTVQLTNVNRVAQRMEVISSEIDALPETVKRAAYPSAGTVSCRPVADTGKMSMHAYAAAIDLNLEFSDYWLWQQNKNVNTYRKRMPYEIVEAFERHGFIWGGKWFHYDTMHFEYRPELLGISGK
jgi:hypothetical protein